MRLFSPSRVRNIALLVCDLQINVCPVILNFDKIVQNVNLLIDSTLDKINKVVVCELLPDKLGKTTSDLNLKNSACQGKIHNDG